MSIPGAQRVKLMIRRDGVLGAARRIAARAASYVSLSEDHVWFVLDVLGERPRPQLSTELTLMRPRRSDDELLNQLTTVDPREARARIDAGHDLWLVLDGNRMLLNMWVFRGRTPSIAVPGGQLAIPSDSVCLEDVEAIPAARGKGIGPAAYSAVADSVAAEGRRWIINKTTVDNAAAQRAVEKAGFEAVALMHFRRKGKTTRTWIEPFEVPGAGVFVERVGRQLAVGEVPR